MTTLLTFSLPIGEGFWVFLPFPCDPKALLLSRASAENTATARENFLEKTTSSSRINKEQVTIDIEIVSQEDVNGEKLTVKNGGFLVPIFSRFGADFFTVYADFSRFIRDINGEKKNISLLMIFFTVSFSRFAPSRVSKLISKTPNAVTVAVV